VALPAELLTIVTADPRATVRRTIRLQANARLSRDAVEVEIRNLSQSGLLIETAADLVIGESLYLDLPEAEIIEATVIWSRGRFFGCEFKAGLSKSAMSAALLLSPNEHPGRDAAASTMNVSLSEEASLGDEMNQSSLPVLVISVIVLTLVAIIGVYALFEAVSAPR
jgi:hypothetical protein